MRSLRAWLRLGIELRGVSEYMKTDGVLGPDDGDAKSVRSLNKLVRFLPGVGIELEADPRHAEIIPAELGLLQGPRRPVTTPGSKADQEASSALRRLRTRRLRHHRHGSQTNKAGCQTRRPLQWL